MSKGSEIILSADPRGIFLEGLIGDTSSPGYCMTMKTATVPVGGRMTYVAETRSDGAVGPIFVLLGDALQGKMAAGAATAFGPAAPGDAYVSGTRGFLYCPIGGEELNMVVASVAGTADDIAIGDLLGVTTGGKLKANSAFASCPFQACEVITDPTADYLLWCLYLGQQA